MAKKSMNSIVVALKLPEKTADFIVRAQSILDTMAANPKTLPTPSPALITLAADISDLVTKEAAVQTRTVGAVADRDAARKVVADDLRSERAYVEALVNEDPANGATIAQDAGMTLRKAPTRNKPDLAIQKGAVSGSVHAFAKATKGARANEWQYSLDGGTTWIDLLPTTGADTMIHGLTPGTTVSIRQRVLTRAGLTDWGQPVSTLVL